MQTWRRLGSWISGHMVFIVPAVVAAGVLFPEHLIPLRPIIPALFAVVTFQNSLGNTFESIAEVIRKPKTLLVTVALVHVVAPVLVRLVAGLLFADAPDTVVGTVLEACVPVGATTVMWSAVYGGNVALALTMMFVSTVIAPFTIPWTLRLLVGASVEVDVVGMMSDMLFMVGIPAVLGVTVNQLSHGWGRERLSPVMAPLSSILVPIIIGTNATGISEQMHHLTPRLLAIAAFVGCVTILSICVGALVARAMKQPDDTTVTMMFDCGIRNISVGAVLASTYLPAESLFPVMVGTLFQQVFAAIIGRMMQRRMQEDAT